MNFMAKEILKMWLRGGTLRWGDYPVLLFRCTQCDQKGLKNGQKGQKRTEGNVTSEEWSEGDATLLALKVEKGTMSL